ncbi:Ldh family oxidoreductase, partial [Salmonella enterica subsp. enterica serovar Typhimurium]|nr:Ldh family oxidoreductase [Salmonella enterica subsp. enterica serovar Typhimurium]
ATAAVLVRADAAGLASHGVSRVPMYVAHLRHDRVDGAAVPVLQARNGERRAALLVDAQCGFAFPACAMAIEQAIVRAR